MFNSCIREVLAAYNEKSAIQIMSIYSNNLESYTSISVGLLTLKVRLGVVICVYRKDKLKHYATYS